MAAPTIRDIEAERVRLDSRHRALHNRGTGSRDDPFDLGDDEDNFSYNLSSVTPTRLSNTSTSNPNQMRKKSHPQLPFTGPLIQDRQNSLYNSGLFSFNDNSPRPQLHTSSALMPPNGQRYVQTADISQPSAMIQPRTGLSTNQNGTESNLKVVRCLSCSDLMYNCDGEEPCSICAEPGMICVYPGRQSRKIREPTATLNEFSNAGQAARINPSMQNPDEAILSTEQTAKDSNTHQYDHDVDPMFERENEKDSKVKQISDLIAESAIIKDTDEDSDDSSVVSDVEHISLESEKLRNVMARLESDLRLHQTYHVQQLLRQARRDTSSTSTSSSNASFPDPFARTSLARDLSPETPKRSGHNKSKLEVQLKAVAKTSQTIKPKWQTRSIKSQKVKCDAVKLPKYKSITRMAPSILARNLKTSKYRPYDAADEPMEVAAYRKKYDELMQRYDYNDPSMKAQRKCLEFVSLWRPWANKLLKRCGLNHGDIAYYFTHKSDFRWKTTLSISETAIAAYSAEKIRTCTTCEMLVGSDSEYRFGGESMRCPIPDAWSLALAGLVSHFFHNVSGISLWHITITSKQFKSEIETNSSQTRKSKPKLCTICLLHDCPTHGAYFESDSDHGSETEDALINDEEKEHNIRQYVSQRSPEERDSAHVCGVYCIDRSLLLREVLGRHSDGIVRGAFNKKFPISSTYQDSDDCSVNCFWNVSGRRNCKLSHLAKGNLTHLPNIQSTLFDALWPLYATNQRGPCIMAGMMDDVTCSNLFYHMVSRMGQVPHDSSSGNDNSATGEGLPQGRKVAKILAGLDTSLSAELDSRPPFVPCSHDGPCQNNPDCSCARDKISCEPFCGCKLSCKRRFKGCTCAGVSRVCFNDARCECWVHNRECDPWLCSNCGVIEVLHSSNKYDEEIRKGRCENNRIQLDLPAKTIKAPSQVQGYGLFAGQDLEENAYIGEYRGEVTSVSESNRRGAMYHIVGAEYLFVINRDQEMDASNMGNKMRFMNNSQLDSNINVVAKKMLCNGVQRVMLYAKRKVRAGEELLYNYNYPVDVTKYFWEPGEKPSTTAGNIVDVVPKRTATSDSKAHTRRARISEPRHADIDDHAGEDDDYGEPRNAVRSKRKRNSEAMDSDHPSFRIAQTDQVSRESGRLGPNDESDPTGNGHIEVTFAESSSKGSDHEEEDVEEKEGEEVEVEEEGGGGGGEEEEEEEDDDDDDDDSPVRSFKPKRLQEMRLTDRSKASRARAAGPWKSTTKQNKNR